MVYLKSSLAVIFFFAVAWGLYFWFVSGPEHQVQLAAEEFSKGNFEESAKIIHKLKKDLPKGQYQLYLAYINREKSSLLESSEELIKAEQAAETGAALSILLEIYLNQAFNAYLTRQPNNMTLPLEKANKIAKSNPWVNFFQVLQEYLNGNYKTALSQWKDPINSGFLSPWMKKTFTDTFNSFWYSTRLAQANIALGNYFNAREELEKESKVAKENQLDDLHLLLGLSYIKEAEEKPFLAATPYYKLAFSYLNRVPMLKGRFTSYRTQILTIIHNQIKLLIGAQSLQDLSFYTGILESWQDKSGLQQMHKDLIALFDQKTTDRSWNGISDILKALNRHLKPEQYAQVEATLNELFDTALKEEDLSSMNKLWEVMRTFTQSPQEVAKKIADKTAVFIIQIIPIDSLDLFLTIPYLEFWMSVENTASPRYGFASILFSMAENMWLENNQPAKALVLANLSMHVPLLQDQPQFKQYVSSRLAYLYSQSQVENNATLLHLILNAERELHVSFNAKQDPINMTDQLKEAESLLDSKNYLKAQDKSTWILQLEPDNQKALRIAGLSDYYRGNYTQAKTRLSKVKNPDADVSKALSIIEIITKNNVFEYSTASKSIQNLLVGNEMYQRLGFGFLLNGKPKEALEWLSKVTSPTPEVHAGKSYAYSQLKDWNQAIEEYNALPSSYKETLRMKEVALNSAAGLGNMPKAEAILQEILNSKPQIDNNLSSNAFEHLNAEFFENESPNYIAGMFYKNWKRNDAKALFYFNVINDPSSTVLAAIGDILFSQKKYLEARAALQRALQGNTKKKLQPVQLKKTLLLLAMANKQLNYTIEAANYFTDYFDDFPDEILHRNEYAKTLMSLRQFDDATKQLRLIRQAREFSEDENINFITCLIHLDQFQAANWQALEYLYTNPAASLSEQINIARLMLITGDSKLVHTILNRVPEEKYRSLEVKIALINLWMEQGNYEAVSKQINSLQPLLEKMVEGLMLLARFNANAVNVNSAVQFAKEALRLDPYNVETNYFLNTYAPDIALLKLKLKEDPSNFSLQIEYARQLMQKESVDYDLNVARQILKELYPSLRDLPQLHYLLGKVLFLQADAEQAKIALNESIQLDPSYSDAYQYLSKIDLNSGKLDQAFGEIQKALHFQPNDSELWVDKSDLFQQSSNVFDAMFCLQKAIKYKPLNANAYIKLGVIQLNSENPEDAKISFETALKIEPNNVLILKYLFMTLHHAFLSFSIKNVNELLDEQKLVYDRLHQLDPKLAEEILHSLKENP